MFDSICGDELGNILYYRKNCRYYPTKIGKEEQELHFLLVWIHGQVEEGEHVANHVDHKHVKVDGEFLMVLLGLSYRVSRCKYTQHEYQNVPQGLQENLEESHHRIRALESS